MPNLSPKQTSILKYKISSQQKLQNLSKETSYELVSYRLVPQPASNQKFEITLKNLTYRNQRHKLRVLTTTSTGKKNERRCERYSRT